MIPSTGAEDGLGQRARWSSGIRVGIPVMLVGASLVAAPRLAIGQRAWSEAVSRGLVLLGWTLAVWGVLNVVLVHRELRARVNVALFGLIFLGPLAAELALRLAIVLHVPRARNPGLYAGYLYDDDYRLLQDRWNRTSGPASPQGVHPLRGWSQAEVSPDNPLGLQEDSLARLVRDGRRKLLFYGDSYVKGATDPPYELPRYLGARLADVDVIDLGVSGYGTDQSFLMFRETYSRVEHPFIVMGVLLHDVDRSIQSVLASQKPFYRIDDRQQPVLSGLPIERDQEAYFRSRTLTFHSFFLRALGRKVWPDLVERQEAEANRRKAIINRWLIAQTKATCDAAGLPLLYVIFYSRFDLRYTAWEEAFLKSALAEAGVAYFDTKPVLNDYARAHHIPTDAFYLLVGKRSGHHTNLGNQVIGDALLRALRPRLAAAAR